jgi:hypothetical protein
LQAAQVQEQQYLPLYLLLLLLRHLQVLVKLHLMRQPLLQLPACLHRAGWCVLMHLDQQPARLLVKAQDSAKLALSLHLLLLLGLCCCSRPSCQDC